MHLLLLHNEKQCRTVIVIGAVNQSKKDHIVAMSHSIYTRMLCKTFKGMKCASSVFVYSRLVDFVQINHNGFPGFSTTTKSEESKRSGR